MANKNLGLGTVAKVDSTGITLLTNLTPPARRRALIDGTSLGDDLATNELGIEEHSEFVLSQWWDPGDQDHEAIDTLFDSKESETFTIIYTNGMKDTFTGKVSSIAPQSIELNGLVSREITIQRLSHIARELVGTGD